MLLNIRGTSGSGKSSIVHEMLRVFYNEQIHEIVNDKMKFIGYRIPSAIEGCDLYIAGKYETDCGGCDTLTGMKGGTDYVEDLVERWSRLGFVIFEGLLICTLNRWIEFSKRHQDYVIGYMDTPLEVCIQRVYKRNGGKEFNHDHLKSKYNGLLRQQPQMVEAGVRIVSISHEDAYNQVVSMMQNAGWQPQAKKQEILL